MRPISPELLEKINKKYQTIYENANPELKVLLSRGFSKDLFRVYTIHEKDNIAEIDVTAKRSQADADPDKLYVAYIENGVAHVKSKPLPYDELIPWTYEFELGSASNVAIDFDGYWERDDESKRFNLVADEYPWVFRIDSGTLKASYWDGIPTELATNVNKIRSVKGWIPANGDETNDQGLIIFYLKTDGNVYYRNYAIQTGGSKAWEVERQITEFTGTVVDIALFRTNDFRVGFIVQNNDGTVEYIVTERNWAGMSFFPENIEAGITDITVEVHEIEYTDSFEEENITVGFNDFFINAAEPIYPEALSAENPELSETEIHLTFSHELEQDLSTVASAFSMQDSLGSPLTILSTSSGVDNSEIVFTLENFAGASGDITISYDGSIVLSANNQGSSFYVDIFNLTFTPELEPPEGFGEENLTASIADIDINVSEITYTDSFGEENLTAGIDDISIVVTKVGDNPL